MHVLVRVDGQVDDRDMWPYATASTSDEVTTLLSVQVHDSRELVGVLATMTALGLTIVSVQTISPASARENPACENPARENPARENSACENSACENPACENPPAPADENA